MESKKHKSKKAAKELPSENQTEGQEETKKSKKAKKIKTEMSSDPEVDESFENNNEIKPKKSKKHDRNPDNSTKDSDNADESKLVPKIKKEDNENEQADAIEWPEKDLIELFRKMEVAIPDKDNLVYSTRIEKLNWQDIAFDNYTAEECKRTWLLVQKRLRKFRLLNEILTDAKEWISKPWTSFYKGAKNRKHPDMPRRPLTTYMIYYLKKKAKVQAENPFLEMTDVSKRIAEMYKDLTPAKREKYRRLAADNRKEYIGKLDEFYRLHPEFPRTTERSSTSKAQTEVGLKKPKTPFGLYYTGQLKKMGSELDKNTIKEQSKLQWKAMSDKKKVVWIDWALDEEAKYQEELKNYLIQNPTYVPLPTKPVLTKEEKILKERVAGKPTKPPMSAYSLFSRMMLQSEEIKQLMVRDRMNYIALQWKNCSEDEKRVYREKVAHMLEQYKLDYATYLESLPEDKREEELQNNMPKRKAKKAEQEQAPAKKRKLTENAFKNEPTKPPKTAFLLFSQSYKGKKTANEAWSALEKEEQKKYAAELDALKKEYLVEFKKFLESLNKKQLKEFATMRKNQRTSDNDDADDDGEEESDDEDDESSCSTDVDSE